MGALTHSIRAERVRAILKSLLLCALRGAMANLGKQTGEEGWLFAGFRMSTRSKRSGRLGHIRRLGAFRSLHDLELDRISFLQRSVAIPDNRRIVDKHIRSIVPADEPIPLGIIKPLHSS